MPSERNRKEPIKEIPEQVTHPKTKRVYRRGKFLGKGGFARCYELIDTVSNVIYAGKAVPKSLLVKKHQKDKMVQEIEIHRTLNHPHVVGFHTHFEDDEFVYVLLELCKRRSLMELHKRRRTVTEPEARYFVHQLIVAVKYLHDQKVIHRDLKLGNLFINGDMSLKVGDFGLATRLDYDAERKKTLCGTPNYIAPEMLRKEGHSYEVDIWAIGCVLFTLLVGKPPFETESLTETYNRIKRNTYHIPSRVSGSARQVIERMLRADPKERPTIYQCLQYDFFKGYMPERLPSTCLTTAPKFSSVNVVGTERAALVDTTNQYQTNIMDFVNTDGGRGSVKNRAPVGHLGAVPENRSIDYEGGGDPGNNPTNYNKDEQPNAELYLKDLHQQLSKLVDSKPETRTPTAYEMDEALDPAAAPVYWVSRWVDYSDKYGLGYQLCDDSVGVHFNDNTRMVLNRDGKQVQYIDRAGQETYFNIGSFPISLEKKVKLLDYFTDYMKEHLLCAGDGNGSQPGDELARLPCLKTWFRTRSAIVLQLNNGTLQINFFQDHTKIILCPLMQAATYIDMERNFKTYKFDSLERYGCNVELASRIKYAKCMVERLIVYKTASAGNSNPMSSGRSGSGTSTTNGVKAALHTRT